MGSKKHSQRRTNSSFLLLLLQSHSSLPSLLSIPLLLHVQLCQLSCQREVSGTSVHCHFQSKVCDFARLLLNVLHIELHLLLSHNNNDFLSQLTTRAVSSISFTECCAREVLMWCSVLANSDIAPPIIRSYANEFYTSCWWLHVIVNCTLIIEVYIPFICRIFFNNVICFVCNLSIAFHHTSMLFWAISPLFTLHHRCQ